MKVIDVGGVFIVLVIGLAIGILFSLTEIWWKAKKIARHEREPVCTLMWREFYRVLTMGGSTTTDNPLLLMKTSSSSNANLSGKARTSIAPDEDQKTIHSGQQQQQQQRDLDSNKDPKPGRSRSNTGLSKKGTATTLSSPHQQPVYNVSMNTNGLPQFHRNLNNFNNQDLTDNLLNDSTEMNYLNSISSMDPILDPPPGFGQTNIKQPSYDGSPPFLPQANNHPTTIFPAQFEPYINESNYMPLGGLRQTHSTPTDKPYKTRKKSSNQQTNLAKNSNSDINDNTLRRRSYLTESPIKWPKAPTNYDV